MNIHCTFVVSVMYHGVWVVDRLIIDRVGETKEKGLHVSDIAWVMMNVPTN